MPKTATAPKNKYPGVAFFSMPCVRIEILGKERKGGRFPVVRDDKDAVSDFMDWLHNNKIPTLRGGHAGGGSYCGFIPAEFADQVLEWLHANIEEGTYDDD